MVSLAQLGVTQADAATGLRSRQKRMTQAPEAVGPTPGAEAFNQRVVDAQQKWKRIRDSAVENRPNINAPLAPEGYTPAAPQTPEPYERFDWETSGSGIEAMGITRSDAASRLRTFLGTDFDALDRSINDRTTGRKFDRFKALSSGGGGIASVMPGVIGREQLGEEGYAQLEYDRTLPNSGQSSDGGVGQRKCTGAHPGIER